MAPTSEQRRRLGTFLRKHREQLTATAVGLDGSRSERRRTPGLRREEVAHLCGLSPTWYTWLEQGRDISVSAAALARLASALAFSNAERAYLFELSHRRDPAAPNDGRPVPDTLPSILAAALDAVTAPAYVLDRLWRARGWNAAAARLFSGWLGSEERSLLRYVFLDPGARRFICDWEVRAKRLIAEFRADTGRSLEDAEVLAMIADLRRSSPMFDQFWEGHAVLGREGGARTFNHPQDGPLHYEQITLLPAGHADYKLVMLVGPGTAA